jgi:hypothetical protein
LAFDTSYVTNIQEQLIIQKIVKEIEDSPISKKIISAQGIIKYTNVHIIVK